MKSGIGAYAVQLGELKVGAVVTLNALGDIYDIDTDKEKLPEHWMKMGCF